MRRFIMDKNNIRLKLMYWYNIIVTGGFACIIVSVTFFPSLRNLFAWKGTDPVTVSLLIPLFFVIAIFSIRFLSKPGEGIILLKMQIFYKPVTILLILYYTLTNKIHLFWGILITAGLVVYIVGNFWAVPWNKKICKELINGR
jgi:hypothetical protein